MQPLQNPPFFVITGGPGSGKTTLLAELARRGHCCVDEDARALIQEQVAADDEALPWRNAPRYAERLMERSVATWDRLAAQAPSSPVYFDRGIGDAIACAKLIGHRLPATLLAQAHARRYRNPVFVAPWWPEIYVTDAERWQGRDEAERTQHTIEATYRELGYTLVTLPLAPPAARADFVLRHTPMP